jgi:hypothetical protein
MNTVRITRRAWALLVLLAMAPFLSPLFATEGGGTFMVQNGAFPWSDRVNSWQLAKVPTALDGKGPLPQQSCGSRLIDLPEGAKSITFAVSAKDLDKLKGSFPSATPTGETISVTHADGTGEIPYTICKLDSPPSTVGDPALSAGLILLQFTDQSGAIDPLFTAPSMATLAAQAKLPAFKPPQNPFDVGDKAKLHIFILMGQSNMVGRDITGLESHVPNPRIGYYDGKNWIIAIEPMKGGSGFGPGTFFAADMLPNYPDGKIGLVPCAVGGTPLSRWVKGADLYENALKKAKAAAPYGVIDGMLWHQGESDSTKPEDATTYQTRLTQMFRDFRADLGQPNLPIVVGELGDFFKAPQSDVVKSAIRGMPQALDHVGFADSAGLGHRGDHLHFSAAAQKEFGQRYADAMNKLLQAGSAPAQ